MIVAGIVILVGLLIGTTLLSRPTVGTGCASWGCAVTISTPVSAAVGTHHWYNFTVLRVNETLSPSDMVPDAKTPAGTILSPFPWTVVFVHAGSAKPFAAYNASTLGWSYGSTVSLVRGDVLSVDVGANDVAGDSLVVFGQNVIGGVLSLPLS